MFMHPFLRRVVDHRSGSSLAHHFRRNRFKFFLDCISNFPLPMSILDLGGEQVYWERMELAGKDDYQITILNIEQPASTFSNLHPTAGDAANLSTFSDQSFDLVFSNSVIEHLGSYEIQQRMASEVMRVGKSYFIQTPNRYFPLEPHFLVPFFQFFPFTLRVAMMRLFNLGWYQKVHDAEKARQLISSHRLLSEDELMKLFPGGKLMKERLLGMNKSLTVYYFTAG